MKWHRIDKKNAIFPSAGTYKDWKQKLSLEGKEKCVYCAIHEGRFGGERNFHVEHFRPKSKFSELENEYSNLFYACGICNSFKGNDWPSEPSETFEAPAYIDPSAVDYNTVFRVVNNLVQGSLTSPIYMIERLYLNRPQLILERRINSCNKKINYLEKEVRKIADQITTNTHTNLFESASASVGELMMTLAETIALMARLHETKPYQKSDVSRLKIHKQVSAPQPE
jgi:uncharacterized protein (TIGR02646 family)